jgi:hypothetical protein
MALAKISTMRILTNKLGLAASARAAPEPTIPTETLQKAGAIIPYKLGQNLFKEAADKLRKSREEFITIANVHSLGHKHICDHDETMLKVKQFVGAD